MSAAAVALQPRAASAGQARTALLVRLAAVAALGLFVALQWGTLVAPGAGGKMLLGWALGAVAAMVIVFARRARRVVIAVVGVALVPAVLLVAGAGAGEVAPSGWGGLSRGLIDAADVAPGVNVPYAGVDPFVRLEILAGGVALVALAFVFAAAARRRGRTIALLLLIVAYAIPATETSAGSPYLRGAVFAMLVGAVLWGERFAAPGLRDQAPLAVAVLAVGAVAGIALGPGLDVHKPWVNWDKVVTDLSGGATEQFSWDHTYGPFDWPRDGRVVMRIKADRSSYWKAANLDGFDGRRWVRAGLQPDNLAPTRALPEVAAHPQWAQTIRVNLAAIRTDQVIGAGSTLALAHLRLQPTPVGSPGTWAVVGQLHRGDSYRARVYVPRPTNEQLAKAGTGYPDVTELFRSIRLPSANDDPINGTEMVFRPFGSGHPPAALGPSGTVAENGDRVLARSPYGRTYALAQRLRAGAATPFAFVSRVETYLNSPRYRYDEQVPRHAVPLDAFLFRDHRGYCQQFSGAMAMLLRMGGVPARVAAGFSPGASENGEYVVRDSDAHSWVEAYFPHYGWVTFDPTPAIAPARAQASFDPNVSPATARPGDATGGDRSSDPQSGGPAPTGQQGTAFPVLPVVGVLALVALIAVLVLLTVRRLRRRRRRGAGGDPHLDELARALRRSGRPAAPGLTLARLERTFAGEPEAAAYVRALREARFGHGAGAPTRAQRKAVRRELAQGWGPTGRLRAFWALPPRFSAWVRA